MSEYRQFTDLNQLAGKTIVRAMYLGNGSAVGIVFKDGTYFRLDADEDCGGDLSIVTCNALGLRDKFFLGVATEQEIAIIRRFDESAERNRKEQRRLEYERLRAEFEGKEGTS